MTYYINGAKVLWHAAYVFFGDAMLRQGIDGEDIYDLWNACLCSEEARDAYLPSELELVGEA